MTLVIETPASAGSVGHDANCLDIALVNNMPDSALEQTANQFSSLLAAGALGASAHPEYVVHLRRYTLPSVPREAAAAEHIRAEYFDIDTLADFAPTGMIITGSDPRELVITDEPFWADLVDLLDWSLQHTQSTIASCLSAHALLYRVDGAARERFDAKCSGVYEQEVQVGAALTRDMPPRIHFPHSRHNDVPVAALERYGYLPVISSAEVGWTVAAKQIGQCSVVLMQGHPEYEPITLLLEYRRDVRRYLLGERPVYPPLPAGYFSTALERRLRDFKAEALAAVAAGESPASMVSRFPFSEAAGELGWPWRGYAEQLYGNWLAELAAGDRKPEVIDA